LLLPKKYQLVAALVAVWVFVILIGKYNG